MNDLKNFDLNLLIVFEAVYSTGNISHAARQLNQSQPTISNALARLRHLLDDQLFMRSGRGVKPTQKAQQLIEPVQDALQMIRSGVSSSELFDPATSKRHFKIVMLDHLEALVMPRVIGRLQDHTSATLESVPISSGAMEDGLNNGSLDLVIATFISNLSDMDCEPLSRVKLATISRKDHPGIKGKLSLETYCKLGHVALPRTLRVMSLIDEYLYHHNVERHVVYTVLKMWSFPNIVANTQLLATLPIDFAEEAAKVFSLDVHELPFEVPEQQIYMTWKKKHSTDPGHIWLRNEINKAYLESVTSS